MNNKDFIAEVAAISKIKEEEAQTCCEGILKTLEVTLTEGEGVVVSGFGCFGVDKVLEYIEVKDGKRMLYPPQLSVFFMAGGPSGTKDMGQTASVGFIKRLAARLGCSVEDAEILTFAYFKAIVNGLSKDKVVKVKAVGQFKVNASKGKEREREMNSQLFLSEALGTVSFTVDNALKAAVNKPFEHFKPVPLADGVAFEDLKEGEVRKERISGFSEPLDDNTPVDEPQTNIPVARQTEDRVEVTPVVQVTEDKTTETTPSVAKGGRLKWFIGVACALVLAAVIVLALLPKGASDKGETAATAAAPVDSSAVVTDSSPAEDFEAANELVKFGAYKIVGVDTTIMLQPGQTILTISSTYFGGVAMEPYIKAVNGGKNDFAAGDYVKIPKLELK